MKFIKTVLIYITWPCFTETCTTVLKVNNRVVCRLINSDFSYLFKDWFNGEKKTFPLRQIVDLYEKTQIKIIQNNGCRVVVEPLPSLEK